MIYNFGQLSWIGFTTNGISANADNGDIDELKIDRDWFYHSFKWLFSREVLAFHVLLYWA